MLSAKDYDTLEDLSEIYARVAHEAIDELTDILMDLIPYVGHCTACPGKSQRGECTCRLDKRIKWVRQQLDKHTSQPSDT